MCGERPFRLVGVGHNQPPMTATRGVPGHVLGLLDHCLCLLESLRRGINEPMTTPLSLQGVGTDAPPLRIDGRDAPPHSPTTLLARAVVRWRRDMRLRLRRSAFVVDKSPRRVWRFLRAAGFDSLESLTPSRLADALSDLVSKGKGQKTIKNTLAEVRTFWRAHCLLAGSPSRSHDLDCVSLPRCTSRKGWSAFTIEEVQTLIARAKEREADWANARKHGPLASTVYEFLAHTGLRHNEAKRQLIADIDLEAATLVVTADKGRRNDKIPLSPACVALIRRWRAYYDGARLFPCLPGSTTLQNDIEACGIPTKIDGKTGQWHRFRKAAVTIRARAGAPLRELHKLARHTDVSLTANVYDNPQLAQLRDTAALMDKVLAKAENALTKRGEIDDSSVPRPTNLPTPSSLHENTSSVSRGAPSGVGSVAELGLNQGGAPFEVDDISGTEPSNGPVSQGMSGKVEPGGIDPTALQGPLGETLRLLLTTQNRLLEIVGRLLG